MKLTLFAGFAVTFVSLPADAASPLGPVRYSAILVDADTSEVLYADAAQQIRHPASITKVMTLFLAFDAITAGRLRLTDRVVISRNAARQPPSKLGLAAGQSLSIADKDTFRKADTINPSRTRVGRYQKLDDSPAIIRPMMPEIIAGEPTR